MPLPAFLLLQQQSRLSLISTRFSLSPLLTHNSLHGNDCPNAILVLLLYQELCMDINGTSKETITHSYPVDQRSSRVSHRPGAAVSLSPGIPVHDSEETGGISRRSRNDGTRGEAYVTTRR